MTVITSTGDHGFDGSTSDEPSTRGGWIARWTEFLFWPWREIPVVMRSVASQLISTAARSTGSTEELAARLDAVQSDLAGRLAQAEILFRRELEAVGATMEGLERRVAALEGQVREDATLEDDAPDVPRLSVRSSDALREVLTRAGELAAQRGLKTSADSAIGFGDRSLETHAETAAPAQRSRKAPRNRHRRA